MAFMSIAPLLWMMSGSQGRRIDKPLSDFDVTATYGVLFNIDAAAPFLAAVAKCQHLRCAFVVTDSQSQYQLVAAELPESVRPVQLYESYLQSFELTSGEI
jgi:adenine-specific DNA-methyltransferase